MKGSSGGEEGDVQDLGAISKVRIPRVVQLLEDVDARQLGEVPGGVDLLDTTGEARLVPRMCVVPWQESDGDALHVAMAGGR